MGLPQTPDSANRVTSTSRALVCLAIILLIAATVRLHGLVSHAYLLDEDWSLEIATGRGSLHLSLPIDRVISPPPQFFSLADAPPWWHIWSHMEVTHPPLYPILLRGWEDLFGDTDYGGRLFSVLCSVVAAGILFDVVRLQAGLAPAFCAGLLMALSSPQVEHARLTRSYALLLAVALLAIDILVRIQSSGPSRCRWIVLTCAILATMMTHYFCAGAIAGLFAYSIWYLPRYRWRILSVFAVAVVIFALAWGPWMWRQRHLFATDDASTLFLTTGIAHHNQITLLRMLINPVRQLVPCSEIGISGYVVMGCGLILCVAPFLSAVRRRNPYSAMWGLWIAGTLVTVTSLDFFRGTDHLNFVRYTILNGPAVCALIPILFARSTGRNTMMHLGAGLVMIGCLIYLPNVYHHDDIDPRKAANDLIIRPGPQDLLVIAAPAGVRSICEIQLLLLTRYLQPMNYSIAIMAQPASPEIMRAAHRSRYVFVDMQENDYQTYFPGAQLVGARTYHGLRNLFVLKLDPQR